MADPLHLKLITTLNNHGQGKGYTARLGKGSEHEVVVEGALRRLWVIRRPTRGIFQEKLHLGQE